MATLTQNMQNIAVAWDVQEDPAILVDLVKDSGILQTALVGKASHGIKHKYKFHNSLPTAYFRSFGEGIAPQKLSTDYASIDLQILEIPVAEDYKMLDEWPGGKAQWFADNSPALYAGIGNAWATQIIYGTDPTFGNTKGFKGLHQYCKDNSNVVKQLGGASGASTSIFAVRWDMMDGCSIRLNRDGSLVNILDMTPNTPIPIVQNTTTNAQLDCYKWNVNAYNALVVPSKKSCAVLTQIDSTHKPTVLDMNNLVSAIYASTGVKAIYCNLIGYNFIRELKDAKYNMFQEGNYDNNLGFWGGVPIVIEENILSTETSALD